VLGGLAGSAVGVWLFGVLKELGHIDVFLRLAYVVLLGTLGSLMVIESIRSWLRQRNPLRALLGVAGVVGATFVLLSLTARYLGYYVDPAVSLLVLVFMLVGWVRESIGHVGELRHAS
jgi:hypothetical protein